MPTEEKVTRKLRAILSADVKGYSLLMSDDESFTIKTLKEYRALMSQQIEQHNGRVVDAPGDNLLAEFESAVDAVQCAVKIQKTLKEKNESLPVDKRLEFRIGVNIGDVVQDEDSLYGEGVNIAARIEGLADAGGVCISRNAYDHIKNKLTLGYEYIGEHTVKNIKDPVRVYKLLMADEDSGKLIGDVPKPVAKKWIWATAVLAIIVITSVVWQVYQNMYKPEFEPASIDEMAYPLPEKPSIAVLAFDNMSGDSEQEYIADGISESIITALSKIPDLFVISRESSFYYKDKQIKLQQVSEELGVRYVLKGSVQKSGNRLRITAQLIDAVKGHHLWAEDYDRELQDLFVLQDDVTLNIIGEMQAQIKMANKDLAIGTNKIDAYLKLIEGTHYYYRYTKDDNLTARKLFEEAIEIDAEYLMAEYFLGMSYISEMAFRWSKSPLDSLDKAGKVAQKIIDLDDKFARGYILMANISAQKAQFNKALSEAERAIALMPGEARPYNTYAGILNASGRPEEAIIFFNKALRLNPYPSSGVVLMTLARVYHKVGQYNEALETWNRLLDYVQQGKFQPLPLHAGMTITYLEMGKVDEAKAHAKEVLNIKPNYGFIPNYMLSFGYKDTSYLTQLLSPLNSLINPVAAGEIVYAYDGSPAFYFKYPTVFKKGAIVVSSQVLMMKAAGDITLEARIYDISDGMILADVTQKILAPSLDKIGTDIDVISNEEIILENGTRAYRFECKWLYGGMYEMISNGVSAFKDNKIVVLMITEIGQKTEVAQIVESLSFDNQ